MAPDIITIPTTHMTTCMIAKLFILLVITRLARCGTSQYAIPKNVTATETPTVIWKCPVINNVLCTTWFNWKFVCAIPPAPPGMKNTIAINGARKRTSFQGKYLNQPSKPVAPFFLPVLSNVANIANAVIKEGNPIARLINTCIYFKPSVNPGSIIWWWNPPGIFIITSKNTTTLANVSLNCLPSIIRGTVTYHADTAVKYQTFTNV